MQDLQERLIRYLRLSITDGCPVRCVYCRPATHQGSSGKAPLSPAEIEQLIRHLITRHGLRKVRLTGGEPTVRPDLVEIISRLSRLPLADIGLTTNGLTLARDAQRLRKAGLKRINISLDSLNPQRFAKITGLSSLQRVLQGIDAAIAAGFAPVKLNTVVVRGENDADLSPLVQFAAQRRLLIRFIELMPMGPLANQWVDRYVPESEMRERLSDTVQEWTALSRTTESAQRYLAHLYDGSEVDIGFITAMSHPFCDACDRIRIASDGGFYPCLMDRPACNLMPAIRPRFLPDALDDLLFGGLLQKADVHPIAGHTPMIQLGG